MKYCGKCGNQIPNNVTSCPKCGAPVEMYEEFRPTFGMGKGCIFLRDSLIVGKEKYRYSDLTPIVLLTSGTSLTDGVAQTKTSAGITLTLSYNRKDNQRFAEALSYANKQIEQSHGDVKKYKYTLQSYTGSRIEVYDDYLVLYYVKTNSNKGSQTVNAFAKGLGITGKGLSGKLVGKLGKVIDSAGDTVVGIGNAAKGAPTSQIIMFDELNIQLNSDILNINGYTIPIGQDNIPLANEIISYIHSALESPSSYAHAQPVGSPEEITWEAVKGTGHIFSIYGYTLEVTEDLDAYNSYRRQFKQLAEKCAEQAKDEYGHRVHDYSTFMVFFPRIYNTHLSPLIQKAVDILVSEEIWTVTKESFQAEHTKSYHQAADDYGVMVESSNLTVEANQKSVSEIMSFVPNMVGGGFGLKGAIKGIATAEIFNAVRDGVESSAMKNASNLTREQQAELYSRLNNEILFNHVFSDYWNVYDSLVLILNENGHSLWRQNGEQEQQANSIYQNLSNPNFPADKRVSAWLTLIKLNPYKPEYYAYAKNAFGESPEIDELQRYFDC